MRGFRSAKRSYSILNIRRSGCEDIPLVQGKEQRLHFAGAAVKRYPVSKVREISGEITTGDQWRNNSRKNEGMEPKQKQYPVMDVTGDRSKVQCCKEEYCIGTWNVRSMNQDKLEVVKQEMARE